MNLPNSPDAAQRRLRIALFSDVHGNPLALDAVLADIAAQGGVNAYWVLGDLAALGYDPVATLERLAALSDVSIVRGNTDRYLFSDDRPSPRQADVQRDLRQLPKFTEMNRSFAWTQGAVTQAGWLPWLAELPLEQRLTLPDGTRLLGVHAGPGRDDGPGIHPGLTEDELAAIVMEAAADLIVTGHTHVPLDRAVGPARLVNLGSVSNPVMRDRRARYALLEASPSGYRLTFHLVPYDYEAVIDAVQAVRHPAANFLVQYMQGKLLSRWA